MGSLRKGDSLYKSRLLSALGSLLVGGLIPLYGSLLSFEFLRDYGSLMIQGLLGNHVPVSTSWVPLFV